MWFSVSGDMRFLSHRDTMTLWRRALVRAQLPVRVSAGFNPQIRLSLPLPRSVGMSTTCDVLLFELTKPLAPEAVAAALQAQIPEGIRVETVEQLAPGAKLQPQWAQYALLLFDQVDRGDVSRSIASFCQTERYEVVRAARGRHPRRKIDLRGAVNELKLETNAVILGLNLDAAGTPRVAEIAEALKLDMVEDVREVQRRKIVFADDAEMVAPVGDQKECGQ